MSWGHVDDQMNGVSAIDLGKWVSWGRVDYWMNRVSGLEFAR